MIIVPPICFIAILHKAGQGRNRRLGMSQSGTDPVSTFRRHRSALFAVSHTHSRGQVLVLVAVALVALIGFVSLAVDIGFAWAARRRMQTAADAAATAGAIASRQGYGVTPAAKNT